MGNRQLTAHKVSPDDTTDLNSRLKVEVLDGPGAGGACHQYRISENTDGESVLPAYIVKFQNGPLKMKGLNGVSNEVILAIVQDRLEGFQSGQFACQDNEMALQAVKDAISALQKRTRDRLDRGVEGKNEQ